MNTNNTTNATSNNTVAVDYGDLTKDEFFEELDESRWI